MRIKIVRLSLFVSALMLGTSGHVLAVSYKATALDSLGGGSSIVGGINNSNQIVGSSLDADGMPRSAVWTNKTPTDVRPGDWISYGNAINDSGQVAGGYGDSFGRFSVTRPYASPHSDSSMGTLGVSDGIAKGINNSGVTVGEASTQAWAGPPLYPMPFYGSHAVVWNGSSTVDLHPAGATSSTANAINNNGVIVGGVDSNAYVWNGSTTTNLGNGIATDINDAGVVAGSSNDYAVIWNGTTKTILGQGSANALNIQSQVVGTSSGHAFLWEGGQAIDLNIYLSTALKQAGWILEQAVGINDAGWIVANAFNTNSFAYQAYVLSPAPEPATYLMLLLGLAWLWSRARARKNDLPAGMAPA